VDAQSVERVRFVLSHQPAVADYVSGENCCELSFHGKAVSQEAVNI
jgi:hypothetical protein